MKNARTLVFYSVCAAIVIASKEVLAFLPNVELVSFLLIMFALSFNRMGSFIIAIIFCFAQMAFYGVGLWTPMYFIVWPLLTIVVSINRRFLNTYLKCAILSGIFGLAFGFFFSLPYFVVSIQTGWIYFLRGIPFDLVHGTANFVIMILLYDRMHVVIDYFHKKYNL